MNILAVLVADYIGVVLLAALLNSSHIRRRERGIELRIYSIIVVLTFVACFIDFITFYFDGKPGTFNRLICIIGNTYCFMANPIFAFAWCLYQDYKLYNSKRRLIRLYKYMCIPAVIMVLLAFINDFYPLIFYIDEGNLYHRLPLGYAYYIVDTLYFLHCIVNLHNYEKKYEKVKFFPLHLMIGPMFVGCILQAVFYGISLMWVSVAVGLTAIYMSMQNELSYLDTLTGIYNRAYLDNLMEVYSKDQSYRLGGVMIDVDHFKQINDTYGHSVGDEALKDTARILILSKPDKATVMRFAGDEFILLVKGASEVVLNQIIESVEEEVRIFNETENRQYKLSLSMGSSLFEYGKDDLDSFFKKMDGAMYAMKERNHKEQDDLK